MKKLLLTSLMMFTVLCAFSQNTFEIITVGTTYSAEQITSAMLKADMCGSHFQTKRNRLEFNDGTIVEMKSKTELAEEKIQLPESCFISDETVYYKAIWSIAENNLLLKGFDNEHFGTDKKYKHYNSTKQ
jgi:hypothetical protein